MSDKYNKEEPSLLQKIQNKTGCLFLIIGLGLLAFLLPEIFGAKGDLFSSNQNSVGTIGGESVSYEEFDNTYNGLIQQLQANNPGMPIDDNITSQYRSQAWNMLLEKKTIEPQYAELGLAVSAAELEDLTVGANTHPQIQQSFRSPETNQFDKQRLVQFLKQDINQNPEAMESWLTFQDQFTNGLVAQKYQDLVMSSFYTTSLEARVKGKETDQTVNASVVSLPYNQVSDSAITITDSEILAYAREHKAKYKRKASRNIDYIKLNVVPSAEDATAMMEWANETAEKFATSKDDSAFVSIMGSETPFNPNFQARGSFDPAIESKIFSAETNKVVGPFEKDGVYSVFKVLAFGTDSLRSVKGSHIQFSVQGADTAAAESEAREVLAKIKSGETTFEAEASRRNYDASRATGGDMGWVREEGRAYPERLVKRLMSSGLNNYVITRSSRGVHIAKATSGVSIKTVKVAIVDQAIFPSSTTDGQYYSKAGEFLGKANSDKPFVEVAESMGLNKLIASDLTEENHNVPGIEKSNKIAKWLFDSETEEGDVSQIIDVDGSYIVAKVSKVTEEGIPAAEDLRSEIEGILKNKKKAEQLVPKLETALASANTAEELSKATNAVITPVPAASFNTGNLPYIGRDLDIIGTIAGTPAGKKSGVIEGKTGVSVVYVNNANKYTPADLEAARAQLQAENEQTAQGTVRSALTKKAEVKNQLYRFFD
ncbi:MAG: hypothetical protein HOI49_01080 [Bacteroidetes bacterium]|jgi:peptidyl-prolyl cis-trans isomerase D|nr:hypothetical protein [Bacteroidota bacterium]